ncbi:MULTISPECIES: TetR/AcrR family transcriptional regulator [unclassified Mycobacteroides]|uniref:TetR/AcrR family transcriptional regulator n=1 Tax=unclassified Mycobacteroides TaxID=2618759 RepID=UPI001325E9DD|nr:MULTISPECIES: TetR/AcrR family transcriptional regulator [unclassified Mycobacteroides]MUM19359.1 hypothetical protein [Mycobacteroides sp. CBMA 326]
MAAQQDGAIRGELVRQGRPRSEKSRLAILNATLALIQDEGFASLSMEAVANRAEVGKATIYRWWPSHSALVVEALSQVPDFDLPDTGNFVDDLTALIFLMRDSVFGSAVGRILILVSGERTTIDPEVRRYIESRFVWPTVVVERAITRGELSEDVDALLLLGMAVGPVLASVLLGSAVPDDDAVTSAARTVASAFAVQTQPS